jgi:hypothetical protein
MMGRRKDDLKPGEERILARGEHEGVRWEHYERQVPRTIGLTRGYRLSYARYTKDMLPGALTPEQACEAFREYVDGIPGRIAAAEAAQHEALVQLAHQEFERDRYRNSINPLGFHGACDAYHRAFGHQPPLRDYRRWAHQGVSEAEYRSDWYQAGIAHLEHQEDLAAESADRRELMQ